ncbi:MAG TPA: hypothetical protein VGB55_00710, partial [Tepidisphaeraceae bacterium]
MPDFLPAREPELVTWANTFAANVAVIGVANIGLVASQQTALQAAVTAFVDAYELYKNPTTHTPPNFEAKRTKRQEMTDLIRQLAGIIQKHPGTTDQQRSSLGLTV